MTTPPNHNTADQSGADACINTDREIWRQSLDYYAPSIHVTESGSIGINVGGTVYVMPISAWHALASTQPAPTQPIAMIDPERIDTLYGPIGACAVHATLYQAGMNYNDKATMALYATPQPFPAPAVQSGELLANNVANALRNALPVLEKQAKHLMGDDVDMRNVGVVYSAKEALAAFDAAPTQAIAQTAPAVVGEAVQASMDWVAINKAALEFAKDYEYDDGCIRQTPNINERHLIDDCIASLFSDDDFRSLIMKPTVTCQIYGHEVQGCIDCNHGLTEIPAAPSKGAKHNG